MSNEFIPNEKQNLVTEYWEHGTNCGNDRVISCEVDGEKFNVTVYEYAVKFINEDSLRTMQSTLAVECIEAPRTDKVFLTVEVYSDKIELNETVIKMLKNIHSRIRTIYIIDSNKTDSLEQFISFVSKRINGAAICEATKDEAESKIAIIANSAMQNSYDRFAIPEERDYLGDE